jgi:hypothetical protein
MGRPQISKQRTVKPSHSLYGLYLLCFFFFFLLLCSSYSAILFLHRSAHPEVVSGDCRSISVGRQGDFLAEEPDGGVFIFLHFLANQTGEEIKTREVVLWGRGLRWHWTYVSTILIRLNERWMPRQP